MRLYNFESIPLESQLKVAMSVPKYAGIHGNSNFVARVYTQAYNHCKELGCDITKVEPMNWLNEVKTFLEKHPDEFYFEQDDEIVWETKEFNPKRSKIIKTENGIEIISDRFGI